MRDVTTQMLFAAIRCMRNNRFLTSLPERDQVSEYILFTSLSMSSATRKAKGKGETETQKERGRERETDGEGIKRTL